MSIRMGAGDFQENSQMVGGPEEHASCFRFVTCLLLGALPHKQNLFHCHFSPGTVRTGTLLALDICMRSLDETDIVDILGTVNMLRQDRAGAVQTHEQYRFIYQVSVLQKANKRLVFGGGCLCPFPFKESHIELFPLKAPIIAKTIFGPAGLVLCLRCVWQAVLDYALKFSRAPQSCCSSAASADMQNA